VEEEVVVVFSLVEREEVQLIKAARRFLRVLMVAWMGRHLSLQVCGCKK